MPKMGSLMSAIAEESQWYRVQILNVKGGHVLIITLFKTWKARSWIRAQSSATRQNTVNTTGL